MAGSQSAHAARKRDAISVRRAFPVLRGTGFGGRGARLRPGGRRSLRAPPRFAERRGNGSMPMARAGYPRSGWSPCGSTAHPACAR